MNAFVNGTTISTKWNKRSFVDLDWESIIQVSQTGRILSFLIYLLEKEGYLRSLPKSDQLKLQCILMNSDWENRKKMGEFKKVRELFENKSIPLIPLKGIALSSLVYDKTPYRVMRDIDILVRESDLEKAKEVLSANGFRLSEPKNRWQAEPTMKVIGRWDFIKGPVNVDLQWRPKFFIENEFTSWDCDGAWQRAEPFKPLGENAAEQHCGSVLESVGFKGKAACVFTLSPADQALYLALQILNDIEINFVHAVQLLDLALVMKQFNLNRNTLLRNAVNLKPSLQNKLSDFIQSVEMCFFREQSYSKLSEKTAEFFDHFFESSPDLHHDFALKRLLWSIQSPWERILFILGYLIPSQSFLRKKTSLSFVPTVLFFFDHWRKQCLLFFKLLLKQR